MANPNHVAVWNRGVHEWNQWRLDTQEVPDLAGVDASGWDRRKANLTEVNLRGAVLKKADLSGARLERASLQGANLVEAKLNGADLSGADLTGADLAEANLGSAVLENARGVRLDSNFIRDARFSPYANDRWSELRRSYSGSRLLLHLGLLIAFVTPYAARTAYWNGVSSTQLRVKAVKEELYSVGDRLTRDRSGPETARALEKLRSLEPCLAKECREVGVWMILLGWNSGRWYTWVLAAYVLCYNLGRGLLVWTVGALRDEEERSGYTPRRKGAHGYEYWFLAHRAVQVLLVGSLISLFLHLIEWLTSPVWLPV